MQYLAPCAQLGFYIVVPQLAGRTNHLREVAKSLRRIHLLLKPLVPGRPVVVGGQAARIPPPSATLVGYVCELCEETSVQGPHGLVVLSPARAALLACDAVVQEADGSRTRKIPAKIRALVYARDRGTCRAPGCGARGFLHEHHEGLGGWRETGHDPDKIVLTCLGHHTQRHKGLLRIEPLGGGQFRFVRSDDQELVAGPGANGTTTTTAPGAPRPRGQGD